MMFKDDIKLPEGTWKENVFAKYIFLKLSLIGNKYSEI